jgi:hypothetical protein
VLWAAIVATIYSFQGVIGPLAYALLLPYLAWVSLATALTLWIWQHNPQVRSTTWPALCVSGARCAWSSNAWAQAPPALSGCAALLCWRCPSTAGQWLRQFLDGCLACLLQKGAVTKQE